MPKLPNLALKRFHLLGHLVGHAGPLAGIDLCFPDPIMQCLRNAANLPRNRLDRRPARGMLVFMVEQQPDGSLAHFR